MDARFIQIALIAMTSLATTSATDIFLPSLPSMASYFQVSDAAAQLTVPICLLGSLIGGPILGVLSDSFPRKRVLILGLGIFLLGTALCAFSSSFSFLLMGRLIQGFGSIVSSVVGWAMVQDLYPGDSSAKIMSWMGSIICIAPLVAPGLGGYIHVTFGWQGSFVLLFLFAALAFLLMLFLIPTPKSLKQKEKLPPLNTIKIYGTIISNKLFVFYISFFSLLAFGEWCYLTLIPFYFENTLRLTPDVFGLYISGGASFYILGASLTSMILSRLGIIRTLYVGILLTLTGGTFLLFISLFASSFPLLITLAVGLYFLGTAIVWGPSVSKALQCFESTRGAASAVRSLFITAASVLGGIAGSVMDDSSIFLLSLFMLMMAIGCFVIFQKVQKIEVTVT